MRIVRTRCRRLPVVMAIGLLVLPAAGARAHQADQASPPDQAPAGPPSSSGQVGKPAGGMSRGVIVPGTGIDPGMKVKAPRMPRQSTPVIHPPQAVPDGGAVIVPK